MIHNPYPALILLAPMYVFNRFIVISAKSALVIAKEQVQGMDLDHIQNIRKYLSGLADQDNKKPDFSKANFNIFQKLILTVSDRYIKQ